METAEAIQARIAEARSQLEQRRVRDRAKDEEVQAAEQRQLLRRELDDLENSIAEMDDRIAGKAAYINGVDHDLSGPHLEGMDETRETQSKSDMTTPRSTRDRANCNDTVVSGEMEWAIEGMSWLKSAVQQTRAAQQQVTVQVQGTCTSTNASASASSSASTGTNQCQYQSKYKRKRKCK